MKKYKFKVENETYDWDEQFISGADVRGVGPGIPETMDVPRQHSIDRLAA